MNVTQNEHNFEVKTNSVAISIKATAFLTLAQTMLSEDLISDILQIYEWTQTTKWSGTHVVEFNIHVRIREARGLSDTT